MFQDGSDSRWHGLVAVMTQKHSNVLADMSGKLVPARGSRVAIGKLREVSATLVDLGWVGRHGYVVECCRLGPASSMLWCDVAGGVATS